VGAVFGRARPATGFNADLRALLPLRPAVTAVAGAISAPAVEDPALFLEIARLRSEGETVITALSGSVDSRCDRELHFAEGRWQMRLRSC
jgi:ATP phosphoribosyltransferase regulatory subunit